tara:strand:+ start:666 stop:827 length:162 start_codon:yes stop_codon:yes gene_type:complete
MGDTRRKEKKDPRPKRKKDYAPRQKAKKVLADWENEEWESLGEDNVSRDDPKR